MACRRRGRAGGGGGRVDDGGGGGGGGGVVKGAGSCWRAHVDQQVVGASAAKQLSGDGGSTPAPRSCGSLASRALAPRLCAALLRRSYYDAPRSCATLVRRALAPPVARRTGSTLSSRAWVARGACGARGGMGLLKRAAVVGAAPKSARSRWGCIYAARASEEYPPARARRDEGCVVGGLSRVQADAATAQRSPVLKRECTALDTGTVGCIVCHRGIHCVSITINLRPKKGSDTRPE